MFLLCAQDAKLYAKVGGEFLRAPTLFFANAKDKGGATLLLGPGPAGIGCGFPGLRIETWGTHWLWLNLHSRDQDNLPMKPRLTGMPLDALLHKLENVNGLPDGLSAWFPTHFARCADAMDGAPRLWMGRRRSLRGSWSPTHAASCACVMNGAPGGLMGRLDGRLEMQ